MQHHQTAVLILATLVLGLASSDAGASNYPPSYDICSTEETRDAGPFTVIRDFVNLSQRHMKLTVTYDGYLRDLYPDEDINIYVSINGKEALIAASPGTYDDAYVFLDSGPRNCGYCSKGWNPPGTCTGVVFAPQESGRWICAKPTTIEKEIFQWAFNQYGQLNAWNIEVAAEANGQWDSNGGTNYHVGFAPRGC
jgi:hypothetical protein